MSHAIGLLLVCIVLSSCDVTSAKRILVFGGNGFLGASTVVELLAAGQHDITIANRGNWYWDSEQRILPHVKRVKCDRSTQDIEEGCPELVEVVSQTASFDVVYDFSAYGPNETEAALSLLKGKVGLYVLISTDSIYDVCVTDRSKHSELTTEDQDQRPESKEERKALELHHPYGHNKLASEEVLKEHDVKHVILRLPDVIGARDTTYRFWIYQLWLKLSPRFPDHPVLVPHFLKDYALSFVYVDDVASLAAGLVHNTDDSILNEAYNLAWPVTVTLEELLQSMLAELSPNGNDDIHTDDKGTTNYFYPSVRAGPVSTEKAEKQLKWKPTPFPEVIKKTVQFYEEAMKGGDFFNQREEIIQIVNTHIFRNASNKFFEALEDLYDIDLRHFMSHDEL